MGWLSVGTQSSANRPFLTTGRAQDDSEFADCRVFDAVYT